ncbi:hypothetical protein B5E84_19885 [Lachnoclostridium sp. An14]|nr:hypothetical protein B5E84_19885 [Lachnoclostridium sp. An14]
MGDREPASFPTVKIQLESSPYGDRAGFLAYFNKALSCLPFYANSRRFSGKLLDSYSPFVPLGFGAFFFIRAFRHSKNKKIPLIYIFI